MPSSTPKTALAHGEVYPSMMEHLSKNPEASSGENVNVSGMIAAIQDAGAGKPWIGFGLYVLCPQPIDAARFIPPIFSHLKRENFCTSAVSFESQLAEAIRLVKNDDWHFPKDKMRPLFWPQEGVVPTRR